MTRRWRNECNQRLTLSGRGPESPRLRQSWQPTADQGRDSGWGHEEYVAAVLEIEINARNLSGVGPRVKTAGFPVVKTLDEFSLGHRPGMSKDQIAKLAFGKYLADHNTVFLSVCQGAGKRISRSLWVFLPAMRASACCETLPPAGPAGTNMIWVTGAVYAHRLKHL